MAVALPRCRSVLMVGTHLSNTGGIRAVVQGYLDAGLFARFPVVYVPTHGPGGQLAKLRTALVGLMRVALELVRRPAPLVHVHVASRASFWRKSVVCLLARAARRPYLLHVHGGEFLRFYLEELGPLRQRFVRNTFAHAAVVIALSEEWRQRLALLAPRERIEVLPNAVAVPAPRRGARTRHASVLFLGDVCQAKGCFDLVRAFARIAARHPGARLVCAGPGDLEDVCELAQSLGLADRVSCPGWLDAHAKAAALAEASIFVLPSYAEGMPMALLEAMAAEVPVIASAVGGVPQVLRGGADGVLVHPGDIEQLAGAMSELLEDESRAAALARTARERIEADFSLEGALEALTRLYARFGLAPRQAGAGSAAAGERAP